MQSGTVDAHGSNALVALTSETSVSARARIQMPALVAGDVRVLTLYVGDTLGANLELRIAGSGALSLEVHGDTTAGPFPTTGVLGAGEWMTVEIEARLQPGSPNIEAKVAAGANQDDVLLDFVPITLPDTVAESHL